MADFDQHNPDHTVSMLGAMIIALTFKCRDSVAVDKPHQLLNSLVFEYAGHDDKRMMEIVGRAAEYAAEFGPAWLGFGGSLLDEFRGMQNAAADGGLSALMGILGFQADPE